MRLKWFRCQVNLLDWLLALGFRFLGLLLLEASRLRLGRLRFICFRLNCSFFSSDWLVCTHINAQVLEAIDGELPRHCVLRVKDFRTSRIESACAWLEPELLLLIQHALLRMLHAPFGNSSL